MPRARLFDLGMGAFDLRQKDDTCLNYGPILLIAALDLRRTSPFSGT